MYATTPELGPVGLWSPKSSTFSGSDSIVVLSRRPSLNKSERSELLDQNHKVEVSKRRCYRASEQSIELKTSTRCYYLLTPHAA